MTFELFNFSNVSLDTFQCSSGAVTVESCMSWCKNQHYFFNNDYIYVLYFIVGSMYIEMLIHWAYDHYESKLPEFVKPHTKNLIMLLRWFTLGCAVIYIVWNRFFSGNIT